MKTPLILAVSLAASLCASTAAFAQLDSLQDPLPRALGQAADRRLDRVEQTLREMRAILFQGRDTGQAVVVQPAGTQQQLDLMTGRVSDLEETLRRLNGQLDTLSTDIAGLRRDNNRASSEARASAETNAQILKRLDAIEQQITAQKQAQETAQRAVAADPAASFDRAMQLFADGQSRAAATAFQTFLDDHPDSTDAPEARYYLGESLFKQAIYNDAASAYLAAIREYPQTNWAPDAMVKLALSLIETRRNPDACAILGEFTTRYPRASAGLKSQATSARTRARCG